MSKLGYKSLVNTQIKVYNKLKEQYPEASKNDLLGFLVISRVNSVPLPGVTFTEEFLHYKPILDNPNKTLKDVIWAIAKYEYFESKNAQNHIRKYKFPNEYLDEMKQKIKNYIKKLSIK